METVFSVYQIDVDFVWEEVMKKSSNEEKDLHHVIRFLLERMRKQTMKPLSVLKIHRFMFIEK